MFKEFLEKIHPFEGSNDYWMFFIFSSQKLKNKKSMDIGQNIARFFCNSV